MRNKVLKVPFLDEMFFCPLDPLPIRYRKYFIADLDSATLNYNISSKFQIQLGNNLKYKLFSKIYVFIVCPKTFCHYCTLIKRNFTSNLFEQRSKFDLTIKFVPLSYKIYIIIFFYSRGLKGSEMCF